ncbi:MAG: hypothetical protein ACREF9_03190, partial [Opitutaceae bacterium]
AALINLKKLSWGTADGQLVIADENNTGIWIETELHPTGDRRAGRFKWHCALLASQGSVILWETSLRVCRGAASLRPYKNSSDAQ